MSPLTARGSATANAALSRWIRKQLAAQAPRVPSLIATVWGDSLAPQGSEFWLSTILRLLAPFRVNDRAVRTGMFRLHRGGWVEPRAVGRRSRYHLTPSGAEGFARAFHRVYDAPFPRWNGSWEGVIVSAVSVGPALRRRLREELAWAGYGRFGPGVLLRPARGDGAASRIGQSLHCEQAMTVFSARDLPDGELPGLRARADEVWSLASLAGEYRHFLARFGSVAEAFRTQVEGEQAFVVRTLLLHAYRRVRLRDPQLPRDVLSRDWPGEDAYALARTLYRAVLPGATQFVREALAAESEPASPRGANASMRFVEPA